MALGLLRFTNAIGGTADFIYPGPATDMQSPASAGAVNGTTYLYYAQSLDMTEWEIGKGAYASAGGTFARTTITANSLGTTAKISFTNPPQVVVFDTFPATDLSAYSTTAQMNAAIALLGPFGQCKFVLGSATTCFLAPFNGNQIKINGALYSIPSVGVQVTNSGLAASTLYYCYAYVSAGAVALEWSTTGHSADATAGNGGVEIKTGDSTRSLVGMVQTTAAAQFIDDNNNRNVRSWFNDTGVRILGNSSAAVNITALFPAWQEDTTVRCQGAFWANEQVLITGQISGTHPTLGFGMYATPFRNGSTALGQYSVYNQPAASYSVMNPVGASLTIAGDGWNIFSLAGAVSPSGTGSWNGRTIDVMTQRK